MVKKLKHSYLIYSIFVSILVLSLYSLWFVFLDRRLVFLYGHLHTTPFDAFTTGRYWMTGLVASGVVLVVYTVFNLLADKFHRGYKQPRWEATWKYVCLFLALPLFAMLSFLGRPPMSPLLSLWILVVLFNGLALALYASSFITTRFRQSVWTFFDGLALVPVFIFLQAVEAVLRKPSLPTALVLVVPVVTIGASLAWLWVMTFLYRRSKQPFSSSFNVFLSGLTINFLLLSLLHYLTSRFGYVRYISTDSNFFANNPWLQVATFGMVVCLVLVIGRWRGIKKDKSKPVAKVLLLLTLLTFCEALVGNMVIGKETDVWLCENDVWIRQGNPPYEKPFDEECGIIDKAFGVE